MQRQAAYLDVMDEDEVQVRRHVAEELPKRPYSPRFDNRKSKSSLASSGAHRRRMKRRCF